ncbi:MAG: hypothetical protein Q4C47_01730 [Planctomycetia bacterium]|nr:hypothetical protein [Planctomycetia bacterium]
MDRPHPDQCEIESRARGVLVVRVRSRGVGGEAFPDAVFTFHPGDPQYEDWHQLAQERGVIPGSVQPREIREDALRRPPRRRERP